MNEQTAINAAFAKAMDVDLSPFPTRSMADKAYDNRKVELARKLNLPKFWFHGAPEKQDVIPAGTEWVNSMSEALILLHAKGAKGWVALLEGIGTDLGDVHTVDPDTGITRLTLKDPVSSVTWVSVEEALESAHRLVKALYDPANAGSTLKPEFFVEETEASPVAKHYAGIIAQTTGATRHD